MDILKLGGSKILVYTTDDLLDMTKESKVHMCLPWFVQVDLSELPSSQKLLKFQKATKSLATYEAGFPESSSASGKEAVLGTLDVNVTRSPNASHMFDSQPSRDFQGMGSKPVTLNPNPTSCAFRKPNASGRPCGVTRLEDWLQAEFLEHVGLFSCWSRGYKSDFLCRAKAGPHFLRIHVEGHSAM